MRKPYVPKFGDQVDHAFVTQVAAMFAVPVRLLVFPAMNGRARTRFRHRRKGRP